MRQALTRLGLAAALSLGLVGAAAAAPVSDRTAPAGEITLSKDVQVDWSRWHRRHYGWRPHHYRRWHHRRHWGWRHRRHW